MPRRSAPVSYAALATAFTFVLCLPPTALPASAGEPATCAVEEAAADVAAVGAAITAWVSDQVGFAFPLLGSCPGSPPADVSQLPIITRADLADILVPDYLPAVPANDPWGNPYEYRFDVNLPPGFGLASIRTAGADGSFEGDVYSDGTTGGPDEDLVWMSFRFVRRPPRLDPVSQQLLTVAEVRDLGIALLSWLSDQVGVRGPGGAAEAAAPAALGSVDLSLVTPRTQAYIASLLVPTYIDCVPDVDGWGNLYDYRLNDDLLGDPVMAIRSLGADATAEGDVYPFELFPPDDFHRDVVWSDGLFFQAPAAGPRTLIYSDGFEAGSLWGFWSCGPGF